MPNSPPLTFASSPSALVRSIEWQQTFAWLGRGWCDLTRSGWVSLLHGALMGLGWWIAGLLCFISIVGIPWGRACFVIGGFAFFYRTNFIF